MISRGFCLAVWMEYLQTMLDRDLDDVILQAEGIHGAEMYRFYQLIGDDVW